MTSSEGSGSLHLVESGVEDWHGVKEHVHNWNHLFTDKWLFLTFVGLFILLNMFWTF